MKIFVLCLLALLPFPALAGEELFTVLVEHYEAPARPGLQGRQWDIDGLLSSYDSKFQWVKELAGHRGALRGKSSCLRILETKDRKANGLRVAYEFRVQALKNLLAQLRLRQSEMGGAGAVFEVSYPSNCGGKS